MPFLDWVNKAQAVTVAGNVPYHLLNFESAHGDPAADNLLVQGDNLLALKALLPLYGGRAKCVYIDPPYNTQSAFEQYYDDKLEHSQWLSMMHPRLVLLRDLLSQEGSIWVQLDDNEAHYARVLLDEIFGRSNFVADITWQKSYAVRSNAEFVSTSTEHILWYCRSRGAFRPNRVSRTEAQTNRFSNPDDDPRGPWQSITFTISLMSGARGKQFAKTGTSPNLFTVTSPAGVRFDPPAGRCWARSPEAFEELDRDKRIWWGPNGDRAPRLKMFLAEADEGVIPTTLWADGEEFGFNQDGVRELRAMGLEFPTPKPERLLHAVLRIATNPGDLVVDSFLGSGTTAAVALKMGRRFVGVEMAAHARSHCLPRLRQVVEGDRGGISQDVNWHGGGGFRFCTLGEPVFDQNGAINPVVQFGALATYLWHFETGQPAAREFDGPLLGVHGDTAFFLLYNGILGDRKPAGGNVLTGPVLAHLDQLLATATPSGAALPTRKVVYGETTRLGEQRLAEAGVSFRQIPYDIKAR